MQNNTGLRLINTTSNTIEIDLLEQGQTGANVPVASTLVQNLVVGDTVLVNSPNIVIPYTYWVDNVDTAFYIQNQNTEYSVSTDDVFINLGMSFRYITYTDLTTDNLSGINPLSLTDVCNEIKTLFEAKVGVPNSINITANCKLYYSGGSYILNTIFNIFYLVNTDSLSELISEIYISNI